MVVSHSQQWPDGLWRQQGEPCLQEGARWQLQDRAGRMSTALQCLEGYRRLQMWSGVHKDSACTLSPAVFTLRHLQQHASAAPLWAPKHSSSDA